jgi:hypothetical protein
MRGPALIPGPDALAEAPELAALHVLDVALAAASNALIAANVELQSDDFVRELAAHPAIEACLADTIIAHADSLQVALARYRDYLGQRRCASLAPQY